MRLRNLILLVLLCASFTGYSQDVSMQVISTNYTTSKKEPGATVTVYEGSTQVSSTTTNGNGEAVLSLQKGKIYKVVVSKPGKVSRFVNIDTKAVNDELTQGSGPVLGAVRVSLFDEIPDVDFSYVTQNPITTFSYKGGAQMEYEESQAAKMIAQVEKLLKDADKTAKNKEAEYNAAMKAGEAFYAQKKYNEAIAEFEKASLAKPKELAPAQRITDIEAILKAQKDGDAAKQQLDQDYQNLITAANTLRDQKKYAEAKAKYLEAYGKKPEQYAKDEAAKCDASLANAAKDAENKKKYDEAMALGNTFYGQKSWQAAQAKYKEALKLIPNDPTAQAKLTDLEGKLNAQVAEQQKKEAYQKLVDEGDVLFTAEKYADAKVKYDEALKIQASSTYAIDRSKECATKIAEADAAKAKQAQIDKLLGEGNTAFTANQLPAALAKYEEVKKLDPANATALGRITEINNKIAEEKANAQKIADAKKLVAEGDALAKTAKHKEAIEKYNQAQAVYNDPTVQPKIEASNAALKSSEELAAKKEAFTKAIADGDAAVAAKNYEAAKAKFNEAQGIDGASAIPKQKLDNVDKLIAADKASLDAAAKKAAFDKAIGEGDAALAAKNYEAAKAKYTEAQGIDVASTVPKTKIAEVDKQLNADKAAADAAVKKASFDKAIGEGDAALATKNYEAAKAKYTEAQGIDSKSTLPKEKIAEVDKQINADKANADAIKKAAFDKVIAEGDAALASKSYEAAKAKYTEAQGMDASSTIPKTKIAEVDKQMNADKAAADAAAKKAAFDKAIGEGDAALATKNYEAAKAKYTEAQGIDSKSTLPKEKIAEADKQLNADKAAADAALKKANYDKALGEGNAFFDAKNYEAAKEKYNAAVSIDNSRNEAKDKLAQISKLASDQATLDKQKKDYDAAMADGNSLQIAGKLVEAKAKYTEANKIDATQQAPVVKIAEIESLLKADNQNKEIAKLLSEGNTALGAKKYSDAKTKYNQVLALDSKNTEALAKLQEVINAETLMSGEQARQAEFQALKADGIALMGQTKYLEAKQKLTQARNIQADADVDKKIAECEAKILELEKTASNSQKYNALLQEGKSLEAAKEYDQAIAKYTEALTIQNAQEPKDRIEAIKKLKENQLAEAKTLADIANLVKAGDEFTSKKEYEKAISAYDQALLLKKDPAVQAKKDEAIRLKTEGDTTSDQAKYDKILNAGQQAINDKDYPKAIDMYNRAISFRKTDPVPVKKLEEVQALMKAENDAKAKNEAYRAKITEAEAAAKSGKIENAISLFEQAKVIKSDELTPDKRIAELRASMSNVVNPQEEIDKKYQAAITAGDMAAKGKAYTDAIKSYEGALAVKPKDPTATAKILEINQILDDQVKASKAKDELAGLIAAADALFNKSEWLKAKEAYDAVLLKDSSNKYSKDQIEICLKNAEGDVVKEVSKEYAKLIKAADSNFDKADYDKAKEYYQRAVSIRKTDPYPKKRLDEIDALMKPKVTPPVVVSTDPKELPSLGTPSTSSEEEDGKKLQTARISRNNRNREPMKQIRDTATMAGNEGIAIQKERTTDANDKFAVLKKENELRADSADIGRQENIDEIRKTDAEIKSNAEELTTNKTSDITYTNEQLTLMNKSSAESNKVYSTTATNNAESFKDNKVALDSTSNKLTSDSYQENLLTDVQLADLRYDQRSKSISDDKERQNFRDSVVTISKDNNATTLIIANDKSKEIYETGTVLNDVNNERAQLNIEDKKQSPQNQEKILGINKEVSSQRMEEGAAHQQNMIKYKEILVNEQKVIIEANKDSGQQRLDNLSEMEEVKDEQRELDRQNFNDVYTKSLNNKTTINAELVNQEEFSKLPSIVASSNAAAYDEIRAETKRQSTETTESEYTKHVENQSALNDIKSGNEATSITSAEKSSNNAEILKDTKQGLGTLDVQQAKDQKDKTQESQQILTEIANTEPIVATKAPNDLGKLYPEGVTQEKFDQKDKNDLVVAIVTRRVVVTGGHGDEYIKTQSINATTYTKNGTAVSENTWQKETNSAKLVKHNF
jgi:tetratricopeptide (TPR) repeat protein